MKKRSIISTILTLIMIGCTGGDNGSSSSDVSHGGTGVGGSMARFTISGDILYTLNARKIQAFDISQPEAPLVYTDTSDISFDVQTLFTDGNYLYVGGKTGMDIYDKTLNRLGSITHFRSCDPVVVQDSIAYVTLNTGNSCRIQDGKNELQVYNVKDPLHPKHIYTQDTYLSAPTGLGIDGKTLFVCDGAEGLKIFDVDKRENNVTLNFNRKSAIADLNCYDLIPHKNLLIVSHGDNVRQFDYSHLPMVEHKK